jgi:acyl-CoA synthetase (AMP-forming)/AMP-acid ligase II
VVCHGAPQLEPSGQGGFGVVELPRLLESGSAELHAAPSSDLELGSIIYTSGTTAHPKGVMLSHRNLVANTRSIVEYLALTASDVVAMVLPFFYSYGNSVLHTHIAVGGTIAAVGTMAFPAAVLAGIKEHRCTGMPGVPSTFARLLQSSLLAKHDLSSLRYLTQAGGPMTPALTEKLRQALPHVRMFVMYGQTEATARLSYLPPDQLERKLGSVGIGIPGVTLRIMDKEGHEVPRGTVGEIVATGDNVMLGYWKNPEETARVLRPEGLRTGDLGHMDDDGYVFIVGRESDMIKSGAHRIGPKEIEDVVEKLPEVAQCAVVGVPDELLGEAIVAFCVPVEGATITPMAVLRICHEHLPRFKMPGQVRVVDVLPKTDTGKLRRNELKEWYAAGRGVVEGGTIHEPGAE